MLSDDGKSGGRFSNLHLGEYLFQDTVAYVRHVLLTAAVTAAVVLLLLCYYYYCCCILKCCGGEKKRKTMTPQVRV